MGERANINFITQKTSNGFLGVNLYSHWGGTDLQRRVLETISLTHDLQLYSQGTLINKVINLYSAITSVTPFLEEEINKAYSKVLDNNVGYPILCFDLVAKKILFATEKDGEVIESREITQKGARQLLETKYHRELQNLDKTDLSQVY